MTDRRVVAFTWAQFGPYHMDRCEAAGRELGPDVRVVGIEIAPQSTTYAWTPTGSGGNFQKLTLFPDQTSERVGAIAVGRALVEAVRQNGITDLFLAGYELPSHILATIIGRALGVRVFVMLDSKEDDKPRPVSLEILKRILLLPYSGGLAAGTRSANYLRRLGLRHRPVEMGYDTVSLDRVRADAGRVDALEWERRPFVAVARFVEKKNLTMLVEAFALHLKADPGSARDLALCGSGPLEAELRAEVDRHGVAGRVHFLGFLDAGGVGRQLSGALCLALPSIEEQWGLVVNEALAFALPILVTPVAGAVDLLVRDGENGFLLPTNDARAWAVAMTRLGRDRGLWNRMTARSAELAPKADTAEFVVGCRALLDATR